MASTIKVDNIQDQCGANIVNKCSTTITLGASGDTITLACGASQTGFGRTGTVDWDTTAKTASFTAVSGNGYFINTTSGAITVTLPASPSAGDIVSLADYTNTWATNSVTVARNSQPIGGITSDAILNTEGQSVTFVYVDGTEGWKNIQDSTSNVTGNPNIVATGGTITTCGDYKIHTFTGPGTFCVSNAGQGTPTAPSTVDYLVIAGGGGGGGLGGGGAGGYRESSGNSGCYTASPLATPTGITITATGYPITVGGGSAGSPSGCAPNGSNSVFSTITSAGGGGGNPTTGPGSAGGSGSGGGGTCGGSGTGGAGNTPPVSPPQGNSGGAAGSTPGTQFRGGGGGGATASGANAPADGTGGPGGAGATTSINGTPTARAGGGGGGTYVFGGGGTVGSGGTGGGGTGGGPGGVCSSTPGTVNTGGGGGGRGLTPAGTGAGSSGSGGSGIVIIRYKYQ